MYHIGDKSLALTSNIRPSNFGDELSAGAGKRCKLMGRIFRADREHDICYPATRSMLPTSAANDPERGV